MGAFPLNDMFEAIIKSFLVLFFKKELLFCLHVASTMKV